jgi:DNA/RNA-binding domain of Phe-tRNA-synthetase-like protein
MLSFELEHTTLHLAVVRAASVSARHSDAALLDAMAHAEERVRREPAVYPEPVRAAVRDVLRVGGYKPTGRGKPASELLLAMAQKEGLPRILNLVDVNNLASLESALPISIFDADRLGGDVAIRFGREGESYVFNASGHSMDLEGLPVVCRGPEREPVGNAVRDSMSCKVNAETRSVLAVLYGSRTLPVEVLQRAADRLRALLIDYADARDVSVELTTGSATPR